MFLPISLIIGENMESFLFISLEFILKVSEGIEAVINVGRKNC